MFISNLIKDKQKFLHNFLFKSYSVNSLKNKNKI